MDKRNFHIKHHTTLNPQIANANYVTIHTSSNCSALCSMQQFDQVQAIIDI